MNPSGNLGNYALLLQEELQKRNPGFVVALIYDDSMRRLEAQTLGYENIPKQQLQDLGVRTVDGQARIGDLVAMRIPEDQYNKNKLADVIADFQRRSSVRENPKERMAQEIKSDPEIFFHRKE
jgi:hypothetical protein